MIEDKIYGTKFYSEKAIAIATFFGGPLVAGVLIRRNFINLGKEDSGKNALLIGIISTILLFAGIFSIPEHIIDKIPNATFPIIYTGIIALIVNKTQGKELKKHKEKNGHFYSAWKAAGIGVVCTLMIIAIIFAYIFFSSVGFDIEKATKEDTNSYISKNVETLPTPEEIIAKNIEARGGIKALKKIKNKKTVTINKNPGENFGVKDTIYFERPNNRYQLNDYGVKSGSNGKIAWKISPYSGTRLYEGDELLEQLFYAEFDGLDGPDVPYKSMKTEGIEQINGKDCYKVVKTPEKGHERTVYYDKNSYMIVKIISGPRLLLKEIYIEEYKKISNILFPYKEVTFYGGQKLVESTSEKIELNIEMPDGIFDIPEEIKAIMNQNETEQHAQQ